MEYQIVRTDKADEQLREIIFTLQMIPAVWKLHLSIWIKSKSRL